MKTNLKHANLSAYSPNVDSGLPAEMAFLTSLEYSIYPVTSFFLSTPLLFGSRFFLLVVGVAAGTTGAVWLAGEPAGPAPPERGVAGDAMEDSSNELSRRISMSSGLRVSEQ